MEIIDEGKANRHVAVTSKSNSFSLKKQYISKLDSVGNKRFHHQGDFVLLTPIKLTLYTGFLVCLFVFNSNII